MKPTVLFGFLLCVSIFLCRCTTSVNAPSAGGGSDLPNGRVAAIEGIVLTKDSLAVQGAVVRLKKIVIASSADSIVLSRDTLTDSLGAFHFFDIDTGKFVILCTDLRSNTSALDQFVEKRISSTVRLSPMVLRKPTTISGRIMLPPGADYNGMAVFVPGSGITSPVMPDGFYTLRDIPHGTIDLAFLYNSTINFTRITNSVPDSVVSITLPLLEFAVLGVMSNGNYRYHETTVERSYFISPQPFHISWSSSKESSGIVYFSYFNNMMQPLSSSTPAYTPPYDFIIGGIVYREADGTVMMRLTNGSLAKLEGDPVKLVTFEPQYAIAAVTFLDQPERAVFNVMELWIGPQ